MSALVQITHTDTPRIYVASLADYNAGRLHGAWIDATQDAEDIWEDVQAMLKLSREPWAEEWAIHGTDNFNGIDIRESESFDTVSDLAQAIEEHGGAVAGFVSHFGQWDADGFEEAYVGQYDSQQAYADELAGELGYYQALEDAGINASYFDLEQFASDLFNSDVTDADAPTGIYVYRRDW